MFVRARMPVVRFHELEKSGEQIEVIADETNHFIVHDFVIHRDGTMRDLNVSSPAQVVHGYGNTKDLLGA